MYIYVHHRAITYTVLPTHPTLSLSLSLFSRVSPLFPQRRVVEVGSRSRDHLVHQLALLPHRRGALGHGDDLLGDTGGEHAAAAAAVGSLFHGVEDPLEGDAAALARP